MSNLAISVENLGKCYRIGVSAKQPRSLRAAIGGFLGAPFHYLRTTWRNPSPDEIIWALKNVSFELKQGEVLGIIGRNGAGKSTLLKILSRITEPTEGQARIYGRIGSLLEVGTGFHPELTGRENIYLNGAILGMRRQEIERKFDEIVDFSGVEKFIETPVKRYSSGMYVRLAFAVAAHLEPEILIVDEVLAVGDIHFQKKCLGKMQDIGKAGRTVLFVSHNMSAIEALCQRCLLLQSGKTVLDGTPQDAIRAYLDNAHTTMQATPLAQRTDRSGSGGVRAIGFRCLDHNKQEVSSLQSGHDYYFEVAYCNQTNRVLKNVVVSLDIFDERNIRILYVRTNFTNSNLTLEQHTGSILCRINNFPLTIGTYRCAIFLSYAEVEILDYIEDAAIIAVDGGDFFGTGSQGFPTHCKVLTKAEWIVG